MKKKVSELTYDEIISLLPLAIGYRKVYIDDQWKYINREYCLDVYLKYHKLSYYDDDSDRFYCRAENGWNYVKTKTNVSDDLLNVGKCEVSSHYPYPILGDIFTSSIYILSYIEAYSINIEHRINHVCACIDKLDLNVPIITQYGVNVNEAVVRCLIANKFGDAVDVEEFV